MSQRSFGVVVQHTMGKWEGIHYEQVTGLSTGHTHHNSFPTVEKITHTDPHKTSYREATELSTVPHCPHIVVSAGRDKRRQVKATQFQWWMKWMCDGIICGDKGAHFFLSTQLISSSQPLRKHRAENICLLDRESGWKYNLFKSYRTT